MSSPYTCNACHLPAAVAILFRFAGVCARCHRRRRVPSLKNL